MFTLECQLFVSYSVSAGSAVVVCLDCGYTYADQTSASGL